MQYDRTNLGISHLYDLLRRAAQVHIGIIFIFFKCILQIPVKFSGKRSHGVISTSLGAAAVHTVLCTILPTTAAIPTITTPNLFLNT